LEKLFVSELDLEGFYFAANAGRKGGGEERKKKECHEREENS
jgi:hypothetical protein